MVLVVVCGVVWGGCVWFCVVVCVVCVWVGDCCWYDFVWCGCCVVVVDFFVCVCGVVCC